MLGNHEKFQNKSDEELLTCLRAGESQITEYLMEKYKNLVRGKARSLYLLGADSEDLIQEGMIGLFKAIRDYDAANGASFFTFADLCIARQMYTAIQASRRQKHGPLNTYISLYASAKKGEIGGEDALLLKYGAPIHKSPEDMLIDRENVENLERLIAKELSPFEKQVLDLYLAGRSYAQIARILGKSQKSTDNALQRVKSKLRKIL